tara:strand:+ start:2763 stop:3461 length:699 start_codon:yes stop_codon:yes gene_type:complete
MSIIKLDKSIIPSCDVNSLELLRKLVESTYNVHGIGGYKIGFELVLRFGIPSVVSTIREVSDLPIIYDHQKAGTDIPEMGGKFFEACKGVDAVIIFPQAGPVTEKEWILKAKSVGMPVIVGGEMTHKSYLEGDGGFIMDDAPMKMYDLAADNGVNDFVVPGNKPDKIEAYRELLVGKGLDPVFYSPGLISQGGEITEGGVAAGNKWHAIIGRGIYEADDMRKAAELFVSQLV